MWAVCGPVQVHRGGEVVDVVLGRVGNPESFAVELE